MRYMVVTLGRGLLILLFSVHLFSSPLTARAAQATLTSHAEESAEGRVSSVFRLSSGYRIDTLNWNIAGNRQGSDPNILSELSWADITIYQLKLASHTVIRGWLYLRGQLDYGIVVNGNNQDSDYSGDNRTLEFSRSVNGVDGNHVWDGSIGVGPYFSFLGSSFSLSPMLGYAIAGQDLNIVDGNQVLTFPPASTPIGPIDGLSSRYQTEWKGPWVGVDLLLRAPVVQGPLRGVEILFTGEYHWMDYTADANWNLRSDLQHPVSFSHEAQGTGIVVGTTILFETRYRWGINVGMSMMEMTTDPGVDRIYRSDGSISETCLNEVNWRAFTFEAGFSYQF